MAREKKSGKKKTKKKKKGKTARELIHYAV